MSDLSSDSHHTPTSWKRGNNPCCIHCHPACHMDGNHKLPCGPAARCDRDFFRFLNGEEVNEEGEWA